MQQLLARLTLPALTLALTCLLALANTSFAQQPSTPEGSSSSAPAATQAQPRTIELYATSWCGYCQRVRILLQQRNLPYTEIDIERSPEGLKRFQELGGHGTPLLVVDGYVIRGYNEQAIIRALEP